MTKTWASEANFLQFVENSIPPNTEICFNNVAVGLSLPDTFIYMKKGPHYLQDVISGRKFVECFDSSSPWNTISAKTGYSQTSDIYTGPVENIQITTGSFPARFSTTYSQANQPSSLIPANQVNSTTSYQKAILSDLVNKTLFIANHKKALAGLPYDGQFRVRRPSYSPIYPNDHNWRTPLYNPEHKNKR